ncbi:flavodoxin family protein [Nocardioides zhouii]|uniref:Flavodoxin-like domain-containing protein n=1 Tax=Nocardioides zhouii TaxID=1168729 RepID=A0A4Q2T851_9ACTN|nr:flavodoxin family protein [Nocardioides zhouii]RYC13380.1 hypothetical protein EUA94_05815 [Nocardioides zhouii]
MNVVIVFESMFGNTASVAADVRAGLVEAGATVVLAGVASIPAQALSSCDLLVLAAPTHAFTLSRPESRAEAVAKGAHPDHAATGLREWLATLGDVLPASSPRPAVAVLDTRVTKVRHLPGSAARSAARALAKLDFDVVHRASFYVEGITGPVSAGEHERAREWGRGLAAIVVPARAGARRA